MLFCMCFEWMTAESKTHLSTHSCWGSSRCMWGVCDMGCMQCGVCAMWDACNVVAGWWHAGVRGGEDPLHYSRTPRCTALCRIHTAPPSWGAAVRLMCMLSATAMASLAQTQTCMAGTPPSVLGRGSVVAAALHTWSGVTQAQMRTWSVV